MLDISTVVLMTGITAFLAMVTMLYVWRVHHRERAVRYWALAFLGLGLGVVLVGLRARLPDFLSIVLGNCLIIGGLMLMYAGTAIFVGRKPSKALVIAVPLVAGAGFAYWSMVSPFFAARVVLFSLASCVAGGLMIRALLADPRDAQRMVYRFVAVVWAVTVAASLTRAVATLLNPEANQLFDGGPSDTVWFIAGFMIVFFCPFGFLLMTSQRLELRLERLASEDQLTGALNRRAFLSRALAATPQWGQGTPASALVLDIDGFKAFNDQHGHDAGDAVLQRFAQTVRLRLRKDDLFARAGGEEFWLLLPNTDLHAAKKVGEQLRAAVEAAQVTYDGKQLHVTVSIGVAALADGDISSAITLADRALYAAKVQGRNRVVASEAEAAVAAERVDGPHG